MLAKVAQKPVGNLIADAAGRDFQSWPSESGDGEKDVRGGGGEQRHRPVIEMTFTAGGLKGLPAFATLNPTIASVAIS
ncbi:MAG TPA: hypothetical protein VGL25_09940 [Casimicrobiaceae bacterium]|jgi:hypothetical protein